VGLAIGAIGGLCLLIAYVSTGGLFEGNRFDSSPFEGIGAVALVVGGGMFIYSVGRAGPERQSSCCGCSCALLLVTLPGAALYFWTVGGPAASALVLPAAVPLIWLFDAGAVLAWLFLSLLRELSAEARTRFH
jgi:hypothetical protein